MAFGPYIKSTFRHIYVHDPTYWWKLFHSTTRLNFIMKNYYVETYNILRLIPLTFDEKGRDIGFKHPYLWNK